MKTIIKLLLLIILLINITGCYDYQEVNNIDIITGIGIDYQDNNYIVTLEILKNSGDKTAIKLDTEIVSSTANTLSKAIANATNKLSKTPNYAHLKVMILSNEALKSKWFSIMDFFLRNTDFRENFYVVTTNDDIKTLLNTKNDQEKVVSLIITNFLENQKYNSISKKFEDYAKDYTTFNKSLIFTNIDILNKKLEINGSTILNNNNIHALDIKNTQIYNLFNNNYQKLILEKNYDNKVFSIIINNSNLNISLNNNEILISGSVTSKILDNEPNFNLRDLKTIEKLNRDFKEILENKIIAFIKTIQEYKTDILGLDNKYYQISRKQIYNYWLNQNIKININFSISKKGLIYEVEDEK